MTTMQFPFGDQAECIEKLLAAYRYRPVVNHRGQWYYETRLAWRGRLVLCRLGVADLSRLPADLYSEVWCGYYDAAEPDAMLDDAVHANIFAFVKNVHMAEAA